MADIQIVAEVVGQKKINSLIKSTKTLEGRVKTLSKAYQSGKIGPEQYQQGLTELRKAASKLYPTHQKASAVVSKLSKDYLAASKAQKEYTAAQKQEQAATRAYAQARREATEANARFDAQQRKIAQVQKEAADSARKQAQEITRLRSKYVEGYGASQKFKKEIRDLIQAKRKGIITTDQYGDAVQRLKADFRDFQGGVVKGSNQFANYNTSVYQANQRTKRFASVGLQQAGYQVGDFAVQLQGGTNAAVAFGQQGSQLLGIFGAGGAIAGAALAITTAFVAPLLNAKKAAEDFETSLESMSAAISSTKQALDLHKMSVVELADKYGLLALEARQASVEIAKADYRAALSDLRDFSIPILQDMVEAMELYNETELFSFESNKASRQLQEIREQLQLSSSEFKILQDAYTEFQNASTLTQQVEAAIGLRDAFSEIPAEVLQSDAELNKMVGSVAKLFLEGSELKQLMSELEDSTPGSGWMNDAIKGVNGLYNRIVAAIAGVRDLKEETSDRPAKFKTRPRAAPPLVDEEAYASGRPPATRPVARGEIDLTKGTLGGTSGGGGGGGMSAAEKQAQEFSKARDALAGLVSKYDEGVERAERLRDAQNTVNEAINAGVISADQGQQVMSDYIDSLKDAENPMQKIADTMRSSLGDAFMSIVDGSKSAGDAFKDMARLVLKQAFELLVIKPILDSLFGGGSGGGGGNFLTALFSANGNAFEKGGKVTAYANGGVVTAPTGFQHSGGLGVMGEAGPEAIMPLKRGKNGKLGVQVEGGSQQPVVINQSFNFSANGDDSVKRIIAQEAPKIANLTQKQILDQRARGGAFKTTFG